MNTITIDRALLEQAIGERDIPIRQAEHAILALRAELAKPVDITTEMAAVADRFAHKLALDLECVLADYSGTWYNAAMTTLGAYREAMNAIHERESPTFMGEPAIRPTQAAPAPDDRHAQELLAMEITLQNMEARHAEELAAYELTVANLRAELAKPVEGAKPVAWMDDFGNAFPIGARKGAGSWMDAHQRNWKPLYLHPPTPAWHDAPTEPGLWVRNRHEGIGVYSISEPSINILKWSAARWYGPIPQDIAKAEGCAA